MGARLCMRAGILRIPSCPGSIDSGSTFKVWSLWRIYPRGLWLLGLPPALVPLRCLEFLVSFTWVSFFSMGPYFVHVMDLWPRRRCQVGEDLACTPCTILYFCWPAGLFLFYQVFLSCPTLHLCIRTLSHTNTGHRKLRKLWYILLRDGFPCQCWYTVQSLPPSSL